MDMRRLRLSTIELFGPSPRSLPELHDGQTYLQDLEEFLIFETEYMASSKYIYADNFLANCILSS